MANHVQVLPSDAANRTLVSHVHPSDWTNPTPPGRYNLVVIGAGTAGLVTAAGAAGLGARVALVERHLMGGDCLNVGCVPSKALLRAARAVGEIRAAQQLGIRVGRVEVEFPEVMQRMREVRAAISPHDSASRFRELGVDVYFGQARFTAPDALQVDGSSLRFQKAVIATGARASAPPVPGLERAGYLTNESVFSLTELPRTLAVIGAGPIGCEMAQAFARFGSQVYLFEAQHGVLPQEDSEAAEVVRGALLQDGVQLLCCGKELRVELTPSGKRLQVDSHGQHYDVLVDEILVAVGRTPNVEELGLEAAGVEYDRQGVQVNDFLQTTNRRIFAAGDVCSRYKFTHAADAMARIVTQNALFFPRAKASRLTIPWCTYTEPELAQVGLTERQAGEQGIAVDVYRQSMREVDRAVVDDLSQGFAKVLARKGTDQILGATIVAAQAGDLISEVTLAMVGKLGLRSLAGTIHPYPTRAEAIKKVGDAWNRSRLTPRLQKLLKLWFTWSR